MRNASVIVGLLAALLAAALPASAATPHKGARYVGFEGSETKVTLRDARAELRVSRSGSRLARGSYAKLSLGCGRAIRLSLANTSIRNGEFSTGQRHGEVRYRLSGRFAMRNYAKLHYSASSPPRAARSSARCQSGRRQLALYENGEPPFTGCRSQRAKTDLQNDDGRVFEQIRFDRFLSELVPAMYACLFSTNKRVLLGTNWEDQSIAVPRLTAPFVGFAGVGCGGASCYSSVEVRDLRDGRLVRDLAASTEGVPGDSTRLTDLVLKPNGSLAWLVNRTGAAVLTIDVVAVDSNGRRVLDSSRDIDRESLTLTDSTLTWINAGATRSSTLN